jgi:hypothetical protein
MSRTRPVATKMYQRHIRIFIVPVYNARTCRIFLSPFAPFDQTLT